MQTLKFPSQIILESNKTALAWNRNKALTKTGFKPLQVDKNEINESNGFKEQSKFI